MEREKQKLKYPVLQKALSGEPRKLHLLQSAYTPEEMEKHEERLTNDSWSASFIPNLVADARKRLESEQKMAA